MGQHEWSERELERRVRHRLAILEHAEKVTGSVAVTCRYFGISHQVFYRWKRRFEDEGLDGLRDRSHRPHHSPRATEVDVVVMSVYLHQTHHFGPEKNVLYLWHNPDFSVQLMGVLIAGVAGGRISIMTTRRRKCPEQIVRLLGQADQLLANGEDLASVCRTLDISESSCHRWRESYGGINVDDAKRLKELEAEKAALR